MDDIVKAALAKWPNVPDCYGWLGLDGRGQWYMRDDKAQAAGPFAVLRGEPATSPAAKGSLLRHDKLIDFIGRNYESDEQGQWFFQNGPQRVYVELEVTPWVWRIQLNGEITSHTGKPAGKVGACWLDERGRLYLETDLGMGVVHTADMHQAAEAVESGRWKPEETTVAALVERGQYVRSPAARQAAVAHG
ncbi:DUF2946 family protein [Hydrogenophaga sp. 5NK40-0174]|uniref:DUF2946 family protein n=1 Tax=Hydrogenophaga sp. 5NK40-0174 TaxID=3127649 RepID=UPI0031045ED1